VLPASDCFELCLLTVSRSCIVVEEGGTVHLHPELPKFSGSNYQERRPVTLGQHLGSGAFGKVYDVASHGLGGDKDLVVKQFHPNPKDSAFVQAEIKNLRAVKKLKATGEHKGVTYAVMDKEPGVALSHTKAFGKAFGNADGGHSLDSVEGKSWDLRDAKVLHYAHPDNGGLIHGCVFCSDIPLPVLSDPNSSDLHRGNVLFTENSKGLEEAHLVDWGLAHKAPHPEGPNGQFTQAQKKEIVRSFLDLVFRSCLIN
jgi:serine/threonine protein kinase